MKKYIKMIPVVFMIALLVGCQSRETLQETVEAADVEVRKDAANVEEVSIEKDKISIQYPKLVNLSDTKIEEKWNRIIEDKITKDLELLTDNDVYSLSYEVATNTAEELSLKLIGSCYYDGAEQPLNFIYTYNISLTTGESLRLSDRTDVAKLAAQIYNGTGFSTEDGKMEAFMQYIYSAFENEELLAEMLANFDYSEEAEEAPYGYSFYEGNKLWLCIEVPHDLGDYIILTLDEK
ncbi:hypothetical protein [Konateibacter massiliensis]|uniref:hypothetical protein n=1 Tax=Konateibacter massiliensis TaxID=2002841 RepID=UPI000C14C9A7|nr:hypothetical protein [Konateibacter massiliensis]